MNVVSSSDSCFGEGTKIFIKSIFSTLIIHSNVLFGDLMGKLNQDVEKQHFHSYIVLIANSHTKSPVVFKLAFSLRSVEVFSMRLSLAESEQEVGCFYGLASLVKHATPAIKAAPLEDSEVFFVECFHHFNGLPFAAVPTKKKKCFFGKRANFVPRLCISHLLLCNVVHSTEHNKKREFRQMKITPPVIKL